MKSSTEISGLRIISIKEGKQIGIIKNIILNAREGCLAFFVVDQSSDYLGARIISYDNIVGLGDYALLVSDTDVIQDVAHCSEVEEFLKQDVKIIGSQVLTNKGSLLGVVSEVFFDEVTGKIVVCQLKNGDNKVAEIKGNCVITYGKDITIIDDQNEKLPEKKIQNIIKGRHQSTAISERDILKQRIEEFGKNSSLVESNESEKIINEEEFNVFEQRQLQFLIGKLLERDIELDNGEILKAGEKITADKLLNVKTRSKLMQLTTHIVK